MPATCDACPLAGSEVPCLGVAVPNHRRPGSDVPRACELAADPGRHAAIRRASADRAGLARPPEPPAAEPPLPGLATRAANLAGAAVRFVASGMEMAAPGVVEARLAACRGCDLRRPSDDCCSACGCPVAAKARVAAERCPASPPRWA